MLPVPSFAEGPRERLGLFWILPSVTRLPLLKFWLEDLLLLELLDLDELDLPVVFLSVIILQLFL